MTRVSFYVLNDPAADRELFICRLIERIYKDGKLVYTHLPDPAQQGRLDELLWTFRQGSFIPHDQEHVDNTSPVVLGSGTKLPAQRDVLLNLAFAEAQPPEFFSSFERALEIVGGSETDRKTARGRYGFYRDRGYEIETLPIG